MKWVPLFIGLSLLDVYASRVAFGLGAVEVNPLANAFGINYVSRGLLAAGVGYLAYRVNKVAVLVVACFILLGVLLWNVSQCFVAATWTFN